VLVSATVTDGITADLEAITKRLTADQRGLAREVARAGRKAVIANTRSRRGTLSFSGMGTKLGARTKVTAGGGSATTFIDAVPVGAWALAERGRPAVKPGRVKALHWGDTFAASAKATSGTPGLWASAETALVDAVQPVLEAFADEAFEV
jgi:hypothetical protein